MISNINLGIFDLSGVIMLVLAGTSFIYLLRLKNRSQPSQALIWFFLCVMLSAVATIITNIGTGWDWAPAPFQDAFLILGGVFLVRFAYLYPEYDQPKEARWVVTIFSLISLAALTYATIFAIRYFVNLPREIEENQAFYLILPVTIVFTVTIFFRRSSHYENKPNQTAESKNKSTGNVFLSILRPSNRNVRALRNYGFALAVSLVPVIGLVLKNILPDLLASFLFNFGVVIGITALMLTYLNYAPESVSLSAKLVGLSLVSILLILGLAGVWVIETAPGLSEHQLVLTFITLVLASSLFIIGLFPTFFRTAIINPINGLLNGVKAANDGNLQVKVDAVYDDEIGYLTKSFNRMVSSLSDLTQELQHESNRLEEQVIERTAELSTANQQLSVEIEDRKFAETMLDRQLRYQRAIAACSQSLLQVASDAESRQNILKEALENLRSAAQTSRAYIHKIYPDDGNGKYVGVLAEVSEPGIFRHIDNPANQSFPLTLLPEDLISCLSGGDSFGGPVKDTFKSTPALQENFLAQVPPLLSLELCPILLMGEWWGYVGFDDCLASRYWDEWEVSLLGTASEMIGNTLQRWDVEAKLRDTLDDLEVRIKERTADLNNLNAALVDQIKTGELLHDDLENRLHIEQELAVISTRLQDIANPKTNLIASLEDLGHIMEAEGTFLIEYEPDQPEQVRDVYEWHKPGTPELTFEIVLSNQHRYLTLSERFQTGQMISLSDPEYTNSDKASDSQILTTNNVNSLLLKPLLIDNRLRGVLGCRNTQQFVQENQTYIRAYELVAGIISNLLQREYLIQTLEEQVTERTRQLTAFLDMAMLSDQALELADILQPTLATIIDLSSSDACTIHLVKEGSETLELISQQGIPYDYINPLREIALGNLFDQRIHEPSGDPMHLLEKITLPEQYKIPVYHTFFAARLLAGGKLQGLLSCYRVDDQLFSPFQQTILSALGELLGIIVENHRLRIESEQLATVEERHRLAREIHDAISQSVYSLSLFARSATDAHFAGNEDKLLSSLKDLETTALQAMREMRLLLYQLRETGIEEDFSTALEGRFNQVERRLGLHASCVTNGDFYPPVTKKHEIWRIIIEALNNVIKHADAVNVRVELSIDGEGLFVAIQDDGTGFDTKIASHGMGLRNMQTRAERLGGKLNISSLPGSGTKIELRVPIIGSDTL